MQSRNPFRSLAILAVIGAIVASCAGDTDTPDAPPDTEGAATPGEARVMLSAVGDYRAEGLAVLTRRGDQVEADVAVDTHLGPGDYAVHIHEGTCEEGGRVVVPLTSINGGESGSGHATTRFPATDLPSDAGYFIQVHRSGGDPVACGDVPAVDDF